MRLWRPGRRFWMALGTMLIVLAALFEITTVGPRVTVRWAADVDASHRTALEQQYELRNGRPDEGSTWQYELRDWSRENIGALVRDPSTADTGYINRLALTAEQPQVRIGMRRLPFPLGPDPRQLFQTQSLCLLLAGGSILLAAGVRDERRRRNLTIVALLMAGVTAYVFPIASTLVSMGDANTYTYSREQFEANTGVREVRFEAHLSHVILGQLYGLFGRTAEAPSQSMNALMRAATAWFFLSALGIGLVERWSPQIVRYLGLALLAPSALLYFGYRELGHLSLNVAAYPLIARGLQGRPARLEAGSVLAGLGAALHGFGLLSLAGSTLAAFATRAKLAERARLALWIIAWGTAAYVGWVAAYAIVLKLPLITGHAEFIPWRPWLIDEISVKEERVNAAILSAIGGRDLLFTGWVVGAPLLVVAASMWRQYRDEVRTALCYAVPSVVFTILFWPIQGLGPEMDLVVAAFPAVYALTWVCAHDPRRTTIAAVLLLSGHIAFWRVLLDARFVN